MDSRCEPGGALVHRARLSRAFGGGWVIDTGSEPGNVSSSPWSSLSSSDFLRFSARAAFPSPAVLRSSAELGCIPDLCVASPIVVPESSWPNCRAARVARLKANARRAPAFPMERTQSCCVLSEKTNSGETSCLANHDLNQRPAKGGAPPSPPGVLRLCRRGLVRRANAQCELCGFGADQTAAANSRRCFAA